MNIEDRKYIAKLKSSGKSDEFIARRLHVSPELIGLEWEKIQQEARTMAKNGHESLKEVLLVSLQQYALLGNSYKFVASALSNGMSREQIIELLGGKGKQLSTEEAADRLLEFSIILHPFAGVDPEQAMVLEEEKLKEN